MHAFVIKYKHTLYSLCLHQQFDEDVVRFHRGVPTEQDHNNVASASLVSQNANFDSLVIAVII